MVTRSGELRAGLSRRLESADSRIGPRGCGRAGALPVCLPALAGFWFAFPGAAAPTGGLVALQGEGYVRGMNLPNLIPFRRPRVPVVRMEGVIAAGGRMAAGGRISDAAFAPVLERAFCRGRPVAVALAINSPGGSPAQSALLAARIRRLADRTKVPVFAFVEDVAASGGYWLACAADEIFADATSIVGSIGVIHASFGLHDFITRHGIERRVYTAGEKKGFMDPFLPVRREDEVRLRRIESELHARFIAHVKSRRGSRLAQEEDIFSGDFWLGEAALGKGLIDGIGHLEPVMRERFGEKLRFVPFGPRRSLLQRLRPGIAEETASVFEARQWWARYGL